MSITIGIDTSALEINPYSGLSEVVRNLLHGFIKTRKNYRFVLNSNTYRKSRHAIDNITYKAEKINCRLPRRLMDMWWKIGWPEFDRIYKNFDIFHSLHIHLPKTYRTRCVLTVHDCRYLAIPEIYPEGTHNLYRKQMERSLSRADMVVAVSNATRNELIKHFTYPAENIKVVHNGFDPHTVRKIAADVKSGLTGDSGYIPDSYLIYIGNAEPRKNLPRLLLAFRECCKTFSDYPDLIIVGITRSQWCKDGFWSQSKALGIENKVIVKGLVNRQRLLYFLKNARALCYPSLYEGFGIPPLEALALGVPVLAGKCAAIEEISGAATLMVNPFDEQAIFRGMLDIHDDTELRKQLVKNGKIVAGKYSWVDTVENYLKVYENSIGKSS